MLTHIGVLWVKTKMNILYPDANLTPIKSNNCQSTNSNSQHNTAIDIS